MLSQTHTDMHTHTDSTRTPACTRPHWAHSLKHTRSHTPSLPHTCTPTETFIHTFPRTHYTPIPHFCKHTARMHPHTHRHECGVWLSWTPWESGETDLQLCAYLLPRGASVGSNALVSCWACLSLGRKRFLLFSSHALACRMMSPAGLLRPAGDLRVDSPWPVEYSWLGSLTHKLMSNLHFLFWIPVFVSWSLSYANWSPLCTLSFFPGVSRWLLRYHMK